MVNKNRHYNEKKVIKYHKKTLFFVGSITFLFFLYANFLPISTSMATAQESHPSCTFDNESSKMRHDRLQAAAQGDMAAIIFPKTSYYAGDLRFKNELDEWRSLDSFQGKAVLVNLWATWCAPCRDEMPELGQLQKQASDEHFELVAINLDAGDGEKATEFLRISKADNLTLYRDSSMAIFQQLRRDGLVRGLPTTLLLDKNSCLVATLIGSAPWGGEDAHAFISALKEKE